MLHRCIEGKRVGDAGGKLVGVDRRQDDVPGCVSVPPEERGRESPPSSSLSFPLDGRKVPPLVHGLHGGGGVRSPSRLDLSLSVSFSLCLLSAFQILAFHSFLYSQRSITPIGLKF